LIPVDSDTLERAVLVAKVEEVWIRERVQVDLCRLLPDIGRTESDKLLLSRKGQRLEQHCINDTKDCSIRADPKRESDDSNDGEGPVFEKLS